MKRILLKLSGEALAGPKKTGFDEATVMEVARQVKTLVDEGIQVGIVIGGGNFWRGRTSENIDRTKADQIGMLATVMNCIYVSEIFRAAGMKTNVLTPFECGSFTKLFSKDRANKYFEKNMVVFMAGGTGHPYFSTDMGTVLYAIEIEADIILSAKSEDSDKILGLNIGADDYVTKPFNPLELVARVKSQLRRYTQLGNVSESNETVYQVGGLMINDDLKEVTVDGELVKLTPIEYNILLLLVKNQGKVFSIEQIYENIWNENAVGVDNTVAVHIRHIREKIEINPKEPRYLKVVWGVGYKIEKQ